MSQSVGLKNNRATTNDDKNEAKKDDKNEKSRQKEIRAKVWQEEVHQHLVAWNRTILIKCIDIAMHCFPPPQTLMQLFIKHKNKPGLRDFRAPGAGAQPMGATLRPSSAAPPRGLWQASAGNDGNRPSDTKHATKEKTPSKRGRKRQAVGDDPIASPIASQEEDELGLGPLADCVPVGDDEGENGEADPELPHDPYSSDFVPDGDKHNLEGYKVLSKRDAMGTKRWLLQDKKGTVTESIDIANQEQADLDRIQLDVENAMDQETAEDKAFIAPSDEEDEDDRYPDDDGGADSPMRRSRRRKKTSHAKNTAKKEKPNPATKEEEEDLYSLEADANAKSNSDDPTELLPPSTAVAEASKSKLSARATSGSSSRHKVGSMSKPKTTQDAKNGQEAKAGPRGKKERKYQRAKPPQIVINKSSSKTGGSASVEQTQSQNMDNKHQLSNDICIGFPPSAPRPSALPRLREPPPPLPKHLPRPLGLEQPATATSKTTNTPNAAPPQGTAAVGGNRPNHADAEAKYPRAPPSPPSPQTKAISGGTNQTADEKYPPPSQPPTDRDENTPAGQDDEIIVRKRRRPPESETMAETMEVGQTSETGIVVNEQANDSSAQVESVAQPPRKRLRREAESDQPTSVDRVGRPNP